VHSPTGQIENKRGTPYADLALLLLFSRAALLIVGILSTYLTSSGLAVQKHNLVYHQAAPLPLEIWARWDSEWYLLIADRGYDVRDYFQKFSLDYESSAAAGFLPLYPLLIRLLMTILPFLGGVASGVIVSNLCLFGSLALLYRLVEEEVGGKAGRRAAYAACAALVVFPMSLFLSAVYAESLFLLLSLACFHSSRHGRFAPAAALGALATVTRPAGVLLALPLAWEWWAQRHEATQAAPRRKPGAWSWVLILAVPVPLLLFLLYCGRVFGDPLAFVHRQERWRGASSWPGRALLRWWTEGPVAHGTHGSTLEMGIAVIFLLMIPFLFFRLRRSYAIYAAAAILVPLCATVWSFGRYALTVFPVFMLMGEAWGARRSRLPLLYAIVGATLSGFLMALFANWWWAG
jgi:hypothetical protein